MFKILAVVLVTLLTGGVAQAGEVNEISPKKAQFIILANENISLKRLGGENFIAKNILIRDLDKERTVGYYYVGSQIDFSALESIEIVIDSGSSVTKINWPYIELGNLIQYFSRNMKTDCTGFASFVKGSSVVRWDGQSEPFFISPGDAVRLSEDKSCRGYVHHAIYLGEGLYISDYGTRSDIIISTLSQMKDVYPSKYTCLLSP